MELEGDATTNKTLSQGPPSALALLSIHDVGGEQLNLDELEKFLAWPEYQFWRKFLRYHKT